MTHIMRRYGKGVMVVLTVALMVVWGIQSNTGRNSNEAGKIVRGTLKGKKVITSDLYGAMNHLAVYEKLGLRLPVPMLEDEGDRALQLFLLEKEAADFGLTISDEEVSTYLASQGITSEIEPMVLARAGLRRREFRETMRAFLMVQSLARMVAAGVQVSLPRVEMVADRVLSSVDATIVTMDGTKDWEKMPAPSEESIKKQFESYKDIEALGADSFTPPAEIAGHRYPFGYKYPNRVQVEYLRFDRAELAKQFTPTLADSEAAFEYYTSHPEDPRFAGKETMGPESQPAKPAIKSWKEVQDELIKAEVDKRVDRQLKKIVERARNIAEEPWKGVPKEEGYNKQMPREKWADYQKIAEAIERSKEYGGFKPAYHTATSFLSEAELEKLKGIGEAYQSIQHRRVAFVQLATHVKDLVGPKDPIASSGFLEVGPEGPTLQDDKGDMYLYRVVAAEKAHAASLEEAKPKIIEDLKKLAAFEKAREAAKSLAVAGKAGSLADIAKSKGLESETVPNLTRATGLIGKNVGAVPGLMEAIFEMTSDPAATRPFVDGKRVSPTTTFAKDETLKVYAVELVRYNPVTPEMFGSQRIYVVQGSAQNEQGAFAMAWLSLPALMERAQYVPSPEFVKRQKEEAAEGK